MKANQLLKLCVILFPAFFMWGCGNIEKTQVEEVIVADLDQLKNLDVTTSQQYITSGDLFPDAVDADSDPENAKEFISLFFKDFDYKILNIKVNGSTAEASLRLNTLDSQSLARDYASSELNEAILTAADSAGNTVVSNDKSLDERYQTLNQLIRDHDYATVETNCTMELDKTDDEWSIKRTEVLENQLVGEFISYITNPDLLSPDETLEIYLSALKSMDSAQMANYLNIAELLSSEDSSQDAYSNALVEQIQKCFAYEIGDASIDGYTAVVNVKITTFDYDSIIKDYNNKTEEYLSDPQALYAGAQGRQTRARELMLECIEANKSTITSDLDITMINDGASWTLKSSNAIANALFGDFTTALPDADTSDSSDADSTDYDSDDTESSDSDNSSYDSDSSSEGEDYDSDSSSEE